MIMNTLNCAFFFLILQHRLTKELKKSGVFSDFCVDAWLHQK